MTAAARFEPNSTVRLAAGGLTALGAAVLVTKVWFAVAGTSAGVAETPLRVMLALSVVVAIMAVGAAAAVSFGHVLGLPLMVITLVLAVGVEILEYSPPPRVLALIPLAIATALLIINRPRAEATTPRPWSVGARIAAVAAVVLHAVVAIPYGVSGLVAPPYGVLLLWAVWAGYLVAVLRLARRRPVLALAVPPLAFATWFGILSLGERVLGWAP